MNYWMIKSEPDVFSIDALKTQRTSIWDGVRNYQARIYLRATAIGDLAFFYHSNTEVIGVAGLCAIVETLVTDPTQFDPKSQYFDPKSSKSEPRWQTVKVEFVEKFPAVITLDMLKAAFAPEELLVVRKGNRLSVMPVEVAAAEKLLKLARG
jgi:predicted RNA-binding protein with PUA-like domain